MGKNLENKVLKDENGRIRIDNINSKLLASVLANMQKKDSGYCVCRQFVYGKLYTMLLTNVHSVMESNKIIVTIALWPDEKDADYYITRQIPFYVKEENIRMWEDFCEAVSGKKAIWENDLLGNFFVGHIVKNKVYYDGRPTYFENIVVDKFIDRLDLFKSLGIVGSKVDSTPKSKRHNSVIDKYFEDEEE